MRRTLPPLGAALLCLACAFRSIESPLGGEVTLEREMEMTAEIHRQIRAQAELVTDPVVLDGAGQMLGALFFDRILYILPVAVEKVEFYRPAPPPGTRVPVRVELLEFDADQRVISAMAEVQDGQGGVWFRVHGWKDVVFRYTRELLLTHRMPTRHTLAREETLPGVPDEGIAVVIPGNLLRDVQPETLARLYLLSPELAVFRSVGKRRRRQRDWLMGRIAAKDAARLWLSRRSGRPMLHPLELEVREDERGRPVLETPTGYERAPAISISHTGGIAAAVAAEGPVGIDIESAEAGRGLVPEEFATREEISQVERIGGARDDATWMTRLRCGKEAAAKAVGTGLGGRPKSFEAVRIEPDGRLVVKHGDPPRKIQVQTSESNGTLFAVASLGATRE